MSSGAAECVAKGSGTAEGAAFGDLLDQQVGVVKQHLGADDVGGGN